MTLDAHTHFELVESNSNFVFYQTNTNQSEFTYYSNNLYRYMNIPHWQISQCSHWLNNWIWNLIFSSSLSRNITNKNFNIILSKVLKHSLSSVLSSSISMKSRGGVQQKKFHFHWPLFSMKVEICKKKKRKWIYEIVTSVSDTHPPLIYVTISSSKEIVFWNRYPPTFWPNVTKYAVFFFWRLP